MTLHKVIWTGYISMFREIELTRFERSTLT